ncbi:MAG TPA: hypothetical protein VGY97_10395 [Solirubrobacteraceae bacterium]|nr:hypothetical protein [Solirubrobacteraceae bacterium]
MGRRQRQREREQAAPLTAPTSEYRDEDGNVLVLRGSLSPGTRREYEAALDGSPLSREDAWHRAVEFLFERLAVRWVMAGAPLEGQRKLLERFRVASAEERAWVRQVLREHCAEHFPDVAAP